MKTLCTMIMALGLSLAATAIPSGEFTSAEAVDATTVRFNWSVSGGTGSADLVLKYGLSSGSFEFEKTIATCTSVSGDYTADVGGFRSGTEYEGRLYLRSGNTDRVFGIVFGFSSGAGITAKPGFRQSYVDGNAWANGFDIESNVTVGFTDRPYAVVISQYNPQSWTVYKDDGSSYASGWGDYRTLGYHTSFWMDSAKTYIFGINVDDYGSVWIDGVEEFMANGSGGIDIANIPKKAYTPTYTGWHDLKLYVGNGTGGYGPYPCYNYPNSGDTFFIGIGWSTDNAATWNYFDNTESATNFKVFDPLAAKIERGAIAGGKAAFVVNFGEQVAGATVYAYAADSFKGDDVEDWGEPVETGMLDSSGVYQFYFDNPAGASYYRFVAALGTTVCNSEA
ncbi:MAG: hypothetical protein ILO34_08450, partial [Kiritimatiellae bacterium]|nr:hypothetical protein [Kiritimatiellia bacterium]